MRSSWFVLGLNRPAPSCLVHTLLTAPAWARLGITAPSERLREAAAGELAQLMLAVWESSQQPVDGRQMSLPF